MADWTCRRLSFVSTQLHSQKAESQDDKPHADGQDHHVADKAHRADKQGRSIEQGGAESTGYSPNAQCKADERQSHADQHLLSIMLFLL